MFDVHSAIAHATDEQIFEHRQSYFQRNYNEHIPASRFWSELFPREIQLQQCMHFCNGFNFYATSVKLITGSAHELDTVITYHALIKYYFVLRQNIVLIWILIFRENFYSQNEISVNK